jgi:hypothetical protein
MEYCRKPNIIEGTAMKSSFEQMGGTYRQAGDYLLPNIDVPAEREQIGI